MVKQRTEYGVTYNYVDSKDHPWRLVVIGDKAQLFEWEGETATINDLYEFATKPEGLDKIAELGLTLIEQDEI